MKKLLISLVAAFALIGAVYGAAAGLTIGGVDELGSDTVEVIGATQMTVDDIEWSIDITDLSKVGGAEVDLTNTDADESTTCDVGLRVQGDNPDKIPRAML